MTGNPKLADDKIAKAQGFKADVEYAQGTNAIAAGTQGQRQWTDLYPNFDLVESVLNSSFDWNGFRSSLVVATENDVKNGVGMLVAHLLSGMRSSLADIRTNWTPQSIKKATGSMSRSSCRAALSTSALRRRRARLRRGRDQAGARRRHADHSGGLEQDPADKGLQRELMARPLKARPTCAPPRVLPRRRLSSHYRTPGGIPMTAYRYNVVDTCSPAR